jgi:hypothetical protein
MQRQFIKKNKIFNTKTIGLKISQIVKGWIPYISHCFFWVLFPDVYEKELQHKKVSEIAMQLNIKRQKDTSSKI